MSTRILTDITDFNAFLTLQDEAVQALPPHHHYFIKTRDLQTLMAHRDCNDAVIGIDRGSKRALAAQAIFASPLTSPHSSHYPVCDNTAHTTGLVMSVSIHPEERGKGLFVGLLDEMAALACMRGHTMLMAKIAEANHDSLRAFEKFGMQIKQAASCPQNGRSYLYMHMRL